MGSSLRRAIPLASGLIVLVAGAHLARLAASWTRAPLVFDVGPSTGAYLTGFTESEERVPVTFRWTREQAHVSLPLAGDGDDAELELRCARFLPGSAHVRLFVNGEQQSTFTVRSGRFRTLSIPLRLDGGPVQLSLLVDDPDSERLGVAIDWFRIENARWQLPFASSGPSFLIAAVFLLGLYARWRTIFALALGAAGIVVQALWFACDPFAMVHVHDRITWTALASTAVVAWIVLSRRWAIRERLVPLLFLLGYLLKGAALFHPSYWYPDVRLHRRYVEAFAASEGSLVERGIEAQKISDAAYPRRLGGRNYALPYSPLFYVPFSFVDGDARSLESIMKHVGLVLAASEAVLVYALARYLLGARVAVLASLLSLFLPPVTSRLLFAQWPMLFGHVLDVIAIGAAARVVKRADERRPLVLYGGAHVAACFSYISSLFNMTSFIIGLAWLERRRAPALLALGALAALVTVVTLYLPFTVSLVTEIVPAVVAGAPVAGAETLGIWSPLERIHLFYGFGFPALALAGFLLARQKPLAFRVLAAYGATFVLLLVLRALSGAFKDLKELVFAGPFVAITAGVSLEALASRGASGRWASIAVAVGLIGFGLSKFGEYATMHTKLAGLD